VQSILSDREIFVIDQLRILIAKTYRGVGNLLFVKSKKEIYSRLSNLTVITDDSLKENELRVSYFTRGKLYDYIDGGIQKTPEGYSLNHNYKKYFLKFFL